ncbi:acyl-CoA thioesterase YciA [Klebsiella pneumoniae]|nr:acyl-CoA thioesterase YciA [Klebsiella pneumoniae]
MVLRTLAMPADTNANGDIFGGWLMSQMDIGGAIMAKEIAQGRVVTVRVDGMTFLRPVAVGDVVCCYARCVKRGNTSVTINIEVWVKKVSSEPIGQRYKATEALFIYVAVDNQGKTTSSASGIRRCPACRAPDLQKAQQRKEEVTDDNHDHRQHVQWEILHQDRMARYHNAFSELLAG